jgi:hypothetical protein
MGTRQTVIKEHIESAEPAEPIRVVLEVMRTLAEPAHLPLAEWEDTRRTRAMVALISSCMAIYGLMLGMQGGVAQGVLTAVKLPLIWLGAAGISLPLLWLLSAQKKNGPRLVEPVTEPVLRALASGSLAICCLGPILPVVWLSLVELYGGTFNASWMAYRRVFLAGIFFALLGVVVIARSLLQRFRWPAVLAYGCTTALAAVQLAWLLRPIIGTPDSGLVLFREIESNGLSQALKALVAVLS